MAVGTVSPRSFTASMVMVAGRAALERSGFGICGLGRSGWRAGTLAARALGPLAGGSHAHPPMYDISILRSAAVSALRISE